MDKTLDFYSKYLWFILTALILTLVTPVIAALISTTSDPGDGVTGVMKVFAGFRSMVLGMKRIFLIVYSLQFLLYLIFVGLFLDYVDWMRYNWGIVGILYMFTIIVLHFLFYFMPVCMRMLSPSSTGSLKDSSSTANISSITYIIFSTIITVTIFGFPFIFKP